MDRRPPNGGISDRSGPVVYATHGENHPEEHRDNREVDRHRSERDRVIEEYNREINRNRQVMKKQLIYLMIFAGLVAFAKIAFGAEGAGGGGGGGGGTTITSGAGDFGAGTSQAAGVLTGVVAKINGFAPTTAAVSHQFATSSDSSGRLTLAQPAFTDISGIATVAQGGTGAGTFTVHGLLIGETTSAFAAMAACAAGSIPYGQGAADPICSTLILPNAATTGDILEATSTNTVGRLADVAVNQVLASGGVGAVPAYTATPTLTTVSVGTAPTFTAGTGGVLGATEGTASTGAANVDELYADSTAHAWKINNNNGTARQVVATSDGTAEFTISAINTFGLNTSFATGQQIVGGLATNACHFTNLSCINTTGGTCTTAPTVNVFDGASNTGTAKLCNSAQESTRGTFTSQAQTQTIAAGDAYGIYVSTAGGTCTTDIFTVTAEIVCP
jgi:hypothetical protein